MASIMLKPCFVLILGLCLGLLGAEEVQPQTEPKADVNSQNDTTAAGATTTKTSSDWKKYLHTEVKAPGKRRGRRYQAKEKTAVDKVIEAGEEAEELIIDVEDRKTAVKIEETKKEWEAHGPVRKKNYERRTERSRLVRD